MPRAKQRRADQWSAVIDEFRQSHETEQRFCDRQGINIETFRKWKDRFIDNPARARSAPRDRCHWPSSGFVEVSVNLANRWT